MEQSEGNVLERISGLMWLVSAAALLAAGFAVSAAMATAVLERQGEIGLMRSLGASKGAIAMLFYTETGVACCVRRRAGVSAWVGACGVAGGEDLCGDGADFGCGAESSAAAGCSCAGAGGRDCG